MVQSGIYDKILTDPDHPSSPRFFEPEGSFKMPPMREEDEIEEISSMAGGSVEGYALPLGAKKKKKKKVYMEPHMHQDE